MILLTNYSQISAGLHANNYLSIMIIIYAYVYNNTIHLYRFVFYVQEKLHAPESAY